MRIKAWSSRRDVLSAGRNGGRQLKVKPNCYKCKYRGDIPGDAHSCCKNANAKVSGHKHGIKNGWFFWPFNFDPVWLVSCTGFEEKETKV